jgi:hypothetical protein
MDQEPFWGSNARPFFIQFATAIVVGTIASYTIGPLVYDLMCYYVTGHCR